jgi:prepilin-type processing-associated H-X9-DG protein
LAYDKALLDDGKGTNVLFLDSHTEYVRPDKLGALDILPE